MRFWQIRIVQDRTQGLTIKFGEHYADTLYISILAFLRPLRSVSLTVTKTPAPRSLKA